jgi:hypothetical protein
MEVFLTISLSVQIFLDRSPIKQTFNKDIRGRLLRLNSDTSPLYFEKGGLRTLICDKVNAYYYKEKKGPW